MKNSNPAKSRPMKKYALAIAFGSGGAPALGSLGVMSVLRRHNIFPAAVSGTSMGSFIAAYYGVHGETESLRAWYEKKSSFEYFAYMVRPNLRTAILGTSKLRPIMDDLLDHKAFKDTKVPVRIVATNLRTGKEYVFSKGALIDAVMHSTAVPGVMPPCLVNGDYHVDGGSVNPTPVDVYSADRYDHFLAIDFHLTVPRKMKKPNAFETLARSILVATHASFENHLKRYRGKCTVVTPDTTSIGTETLRFDKSKEYIARGEKAGKALIRKWKKNGLYEHLRSG